MRAKNQLIVSEQAEEKQPVLLLPAKTEGVYRLFGALSTPASLVWTEQDTVDITIAFMFTSADWWAEP